MKKKTETNDLIKLLLSDLNSDDFNILDPCIISYSPKYFEKKLKIFSDELNNQPPYYKLYH